MIESYDANPGLRPEILGLMTRAFDYDFVAHEAAARQLGCRWEACSTPFVARVDGAAVAHVGVLRIPVVLDGHPTTIAGIHAVCTDPDHRGHGHCRRALEAAIDWAGARQQTLVLGTDKPDLYARFGFRPVTEHRYLGPTTTGTRADELRPLDRADPDALARLIRLLRERAPVSHQLGVVDEVDVFAFDAAFHTLHVADDTVLVHRTADGICHVYDIVARQLPTLDTLRAWLPADHRLALWFTPDRFPADWDPVPRDDGETWMARGPFPDRPMPEMARC